MADTSYDATDVENDSTDVETDAAPSVGVINLSSLDIGSECTVSTESVPVGEQNISNLCSRHEEVVGKPSAESRDQVPIFHDLQVIDRGQQVVDQDIDSSLGSLNLAETSPIEEKVEDDECVVNALLDQDADGDTLLHVAIIQDNIVLALQLIKLMIGLNLPLDISNRLQQTTLHLAILIARSNLVQNLLLAGASPFVRDQQLRTPAFIACEMNNKAMLKVIMQNANWHMRDDEAISKLLNSKAHCLDLPNADGERCLHVAVKQDNIEMVRQLIENGADPNLPDRRSGRTPLHVAADLGRVEITRFLISVENIDVNQRTYNGESAIEISRMRERPEVLALLQPHSYPMMRR